MHLETLRIKNFRRLRDVRIDLAQDISIFVGANNSGKTSATHAIELFLTPYAREKFSVHDFSAGSWAAINAFGEQVANAELPTISLDLWFNVGPADLHRVVDILPSLDWQDSLVGIRVKLAAIDPVRLRANYSAQREAALASIVAQDDQPYDPFPRNLYDYLGTHLLREFDLAYFVLDRTKFDNDFVQNDDRYAPLPLARGTSRSGKEIVESLIKVDTLHAQRHLSDSGAGGRTEDLSRRISRLYQRSLEKKADDYNVIRALVDAEASLNEHLGNVFEPLLGRIGELGYPGIANPRLVIKTTLNPTVVMSSADGAQVHYALSEPGDEQSLTLPDRYNGLGYKNLIYMVVELLDVHSKWVEIEENRPPLHLVFIEEPEAHLHAQLQQVFIRKVLDILKIEGDDAAVCASQVVVTTHSPHILYERGFVPIRYFRRFQTGAAQSSEVLNLSAYYNAIGPPMSEFLVRYLKLTHCDLFFADAAVLVEGNVERILLPQMIETTVPRLKSAYLSILEVGGAYGYLFRELIEFMGITTLIITDIDSVFGHAAEPPPAAAEGVGGAPAIIAEPEEVVDQPADDGDDDDADDGNPEKPGRACLVATQNAVTSNQTLIQWLPGLKPIAQLLIATPEARTQARAHEGECLVRVAYQLEVEVTWGGETQNLVGRTLEEAFALENLAWCQHIDRKPLKLRFRGAENLALAQLAERIHKRVQSSSFKKTDFALALLAQNSNNWRVPAYIRDGLNWLQEEILPAEPAPEAGPEPAPMAADVGAAT